MKFARIFYVSLVALFLTVTASFSMPSAGNQKIFTDVTEEQRPFDFNDKHYQNNGVEGRLIVNRRTGVDRYSVVDFINSPIHRDVRIIGTSAAYNQDGKPVYWSLFGELFRDGFTNDKLGRQAFETANRYPVFTFPSIIRKDSDRQAAVFEIGDEYFDKNPIGLGVVVLVEYTKQANTKEGQEALKKLAGRNGITIDGTPIIRTVQEIQDFTRRGLVTQKIKGTADGKQPAYQIAGVLKDPRMGAISPDAFLEMVLKDDGKPLDAEMIFYNNFECLQKTGSWCLQ
jgi:hypothetical protein